MEQLRNWRLSLPEERTLEAASRLLGVSAVQLSRYETGARRIPAERVQAIAKLTGIAPHALRPDVFEADASDAHVSAEAEAPAETAVATEKGLPSLDCTGGAAMTGSASSNSLSRSEEAA